MAVVTQLQIRRSLKSASNYAEWRDAAEAHDRYHKLDRWRSKDPTNQYDYVSIRNRLDRLRSLKARHDNRGLLYTLNEGIHGNMGGMGRSGLYGKAMLGTKHLVEDYIEEIVDTLELIEAADAAEISPEEKLDFFHRASHCFGHTAFMMSGSGSLLYFHVGVVKALVEADLLPTVMSGSSGGAIVGSVVCSHTNEELPEMLQAQYFLDTVPEGAKRTGVTHVSDLEQTLSEYLPDLTFDQAFRKSGRAMNVSIAPAEKHQTSRLLNATTSPSVLIPGTAAGDPAGAG